MTEQEILKNLGRGKDLRGQRFGRLIPLYPLKERHGKAVVWHCKCDCGNECDVIGASLKKTKSCGCLKAEVLKQYSFQKGHIPDNFQDLTGKKFNKLTVLRKISHGESKTLWECQCDCGSIVTVDAYSLTTGHTKSCGCLLSSGEDKIANLLNLNQIKFEKQKSFDTCKFSESKKLAKFDFYLPTYNTLIEYDGEQHFRAGSGWNTQEHLQETQKRDIFKNQWCKNNNITLIRIPYIKYDSLTIADLLPESSLFIIK